MVKIIWSTSKKIRGKNIQNLPPISRKNKPNKTVSIPKALFILLSIFTPFRDLLQRESKDDENSSSDFSPKLCK